MLVTKNRKARRDFEIIEKFKAGISLRGYEVKAIKEGKAKLEGSYVQIIDGDPYVVNMHVGRYSRQSQKIDEAEFSRSRKLLLQKNEIQRIHQEISQKGKTAVPLALVVEHGLVKLEFAIVKGRKQREKKVLVKERQIERDLQRQTKELGIR